MIELGTRELTAQVVYALFGRYFPPAATTALARAGNTRCTLAPQPDFPDDQFTVTATQRDVLTLEIRRRHLRPGIDERPAVEANDCRPLVLLIDDVLDHLDFYGLVLEDRYRVIQASRGEKGVELAIAERPDAIVCDLSMPGLDGWGVCRRLSADPRTASIPILILTAVADHGIEAEGSRAGAFCVIKKPCPVEALLQRVDFALERVS